MQEIRIFMKILDKNFIYKNSNKLIKKRISFRSQENTDLQVDKPMQESTGVKLGKGIASLLLPGLGQFIDGRNKIGFIYSGIAVGLFISQIIVTKKYTNAIITKQKINLDNIGLMSSFILLGKMITKIASCVDAFMNSGKNKKDN